MLTLGVGLIVYLVVTAQAADTAGSQSNSVELRETPLSPSDLQSIADDQLLPEGVSLPPADVTLSPDDVTCADCAPFVSLYSVDRRQTVGDVWSADEPEDTGSHRSRSGRIDTDELTLSGDKYDVIYNANDDVAIFSSLEDGRISPSEALESKSDLDSTALSTETVDVSTTTSLISTPTRTDVNTTPTPIPTTTTSTASTTSNSATAAATTPTPILPDPPNSTAPHWQSNSMCHCDFMVDRCDTECCCDPDCLSVDRAVFSRCLKNPTAQPEGRYCMRSSLLLSSSITALSNSSRSALFCVIRDNLVARDYYQPVSPALTSMEFDKLVAPLSGRRGNYGWHKPDRALRLKRHIQPPPPSTPTQSAEGKRYMSGNPLWINSDGNSLVWTLPWSGLLSTSVCDGQRPVQFLYDASTTCWQPAVTNSLARVSARRLYRRQCLLANISQPEIDTLSYTTCLSDPKREKSVDGSDSAHTSRYVVIQPFLCSSAERLHPNNLHDCSPVEDLPDPRRSPGTDLIENAMTGYYFRLEQHAGVISSARLYVTLGPIRLNQPSELSARVQFFTSPPGGDTSSDERQGWKQRSGSPGYAWGRPVLAAPRLDNETVDWRAVAPLRLLGPECEVAQGRPLLFGQHVWSGCRLQLPSGTCLRVQGLLLARLVGASGGNVSEVLLSEYGDATRGRWLPIVTTGADSAPRAVPGSPGCSGLVTQLHWQLAYTWTGRADNRQRRLVGVRAEFATDTPELSPPLITDKQQRPSVSLVTTVRFLDVTAGIRRQFAQPPRVELRVPADFFYPFTVASTAACVNTLSITSLSIYTMMMLLFV